ncbi:uncharacterized protein CLUP02_05506 [Colletotrichum lupini]|uniref:Uncharacterized protein n=1 Tax=Colletotrichum lupini TaxID=145971 RepID=A0A9Q8SMN9_9PEZI|nr:uncharacterized protein CLUP02_05506 [Colletotrichum lupini]UQC80025.1 hypothetical protein CLUP02_05506 [Colletotrichum lupini]
MSALSAAQLTIATMACTTSPDGGNIAPNFAGLPPSVFAPSQCDAHEAINLVFSLNVNVNGTPQTMEERRKEAMGHCLAPPCRAPGALTVHLTTLTLGVQY